MSSKGVFFGLILGLFSSALLAQNTAAILAEPKQTKEVSYTISGTPIYAWVYAHDKAIKQYKGVTGIGFQIDLNRYRLDKKAMEFAGIRYNSGYSLQYLKFSNDDLGQVVNLSYFIEPFLIDKPSFSLRIRAAGGLNYGSNPWNAVSNPINYAYSWPFNGYLGFGVHTHFRLNEQQAMFANATYGHFSNGNTRNPNFGLNYPFVGIGFEQKLMQKTRPLGKVLLYPERWRFDIGILASNKSLPDYKHMRFWSYGLMANVSYRTGNLHAWTIGIEAFKDESMKFALKHHNVYYVNTYDLRMLGLLAGHEFLFNRMIFSQQLGYYLHNEVPKEFIGNFYHRFGINYKLNKHLMLGLNLNSNMQKAYILDARLVFSLFGRSR
ncbi:MAG: acyloxyacyl hydrolase [Bacteroidia bacterium]|nr:acyloxyacyl hydrolase [Bacteroidia bacterium]